MLTGSQIMKLMKLGVDLQSSYNVRTSKTRMLRRCSKTTRNQRKARKLARILSAQRA